MMHKQDVFITARYLKTLYMLYFIFLLAATVMGYKLVSLGPLFTAPGSGLIFTLTFFLGSVITEIYGYQVMRRIIWLTLIFSAIFVILISIFSILPSPEYWHTGVAYGDIFFYIFHFTVAGGLAFVVSAMLNAYIIARTKVKYQGKHFWLRCFIAAAISEIAADFITLFISFFGDWGIKQTFMVLGSEYLYKLAYSVVCMLLAVALVIWLKRREKLDVYDHDTRFNPLKMSL